LPIVFLIIIFVSITEIYSSACGIIIQLNCFAIRLYNDFQYKSFFEQRFFPLKAEDNDY